MTKKLRLPLLIMSGVHGYCMSQGTNGIDLTSTNDGAVYRNHATEARAIEFLDNGTWEVAGLKADNQGSFAVYRDIVKAAKAEVEAAKKALGNKELLLSAAEASLEATRKPYLI